MCWLKWHERLVRWYAERRRMVLLSRGEFQRLRTKAHRGPREKSLITILSQVQPAHAARALALIPQLNGQFYQDLVAVLSRAAELGPGYYIEFGATDGVQISNTLLLERLGWQGVLAEPAHHWHEALRANRQAYISTDCVWRESGAELPFSQTREPMLSGVSAALGTDEGRPQQPVQCYSVRTVSLQDLLLQAGAPREIDFLSIDTEGTELAILTPFPFADWQIRLICVEHNERPDRADMARLLTGHGYRQVLHNASRVDDYYVHPAAYERFGEVFRLDGRA